MPRERTYSNQKLTDESLLVLIVIGTCDLTGKEIINEIQIQTENRLALSASTIYQIIKNLKKYGFVNEIKKIGKQKYIHITDYGLQILYNEISRREDYLSILNNIIIENKLG